MSFLTLQEFTRIDDLKMQALVVARLHCAALAWYTKVSWCSCEALEVTKLRLQSGRLQVEQSRFSHRESWYRSTTLFATP